jgi:uncharacterized Zn finger protein
MNVIKTPRFNVCECEVCGTVFEPHYYDELQYVFHPENFMPSQIYARCPTCSGLVEVTKNEEQKENISPEDVRKMSRSEVRDNYKAIINSMKNWK